jgi:hypothetical protein
MKRIALISVCLVSQMTFAEGRPPAGPSLTKADFYVAPGGSDTGSGSREKPFATIAKARDAARQIIAKGLEKGLAVCVRGGTYCLEETLVFGPEDSGTDEHAITWFAHPGEDVQISGGREIKGWQEGEGGVWTTALPEVKGGDWHFEELFVNDRRATLARAPNQGYFKVVKPGPDNHTSFHFSEGHIRKYRQFRQAAVILLSEWNTSRIRIADIDMATRKVSFAYRKAKHPRDRYRITAWEPHPPYFVENAIELLDHPGEWHLDRTTGVLSYMPRDGEDMRRVRVFAPRIDPLVRIKGDGAKGVFVKNLVFEGLAFVHCASLVDLPRYAASQAGNHEKADGTRGSVVAAVRLEAARNCRFRDGRFAHVGGTGISIGPWCANNEVSGCVIFDCGGSGVMIGRSSHNPPASVAKDNRIVDCVIHDCGKRFYGTIGVWAGITDGTVIAHNEIFNLPYTGVSVGWRWNPKPTPCANNRVENNHIHHVMQRLSDGAGVYTLGSQPGTVIKGNDIHDAISHHSRKLAQGIYTDMGSTGIRVEGNLVRAVSGHCLMMHKAVKLTVRDNIFVGHGRKKAVRYAGTDKRTVEVAGNTVLEKGDAASVRLAAEGRSGRALLCDGLGSFVRIPHKDELEAERFTLEAWVKLDRYPTGKDPRRWVVAKNGHEWTQGHFGIMVGGSRAGAFLNIGGGKENVFSVSAGSSRLALNTWHHLAVTYDGDTLTLYLEGKAAGSRTVKKKRVKAGGAMTIGARPDGMAKFNLAGLVDEVAFYARSLSAEEIAARHKAPGQKPPRGLAGRWSFEAEDETDRRMAAIMKSAGPRKRKK